MSVRRIQIARNRWRDILETLGVSVLPSGCRSGMFPAVFKAGSAKIV